MTIINTFTSQRLVFEGKNETFLLENASNLTHKFCITVLTKNFLVKKLIHVLNLMHF